MEFYKKWMLKFQYQLKYRFKMVLFVWQLYYSDDILMIAIQTDPIWHLPIKKNPRNEYIEYIDFDSRYCISLEIPTPASPSSLTHNTLLNFLKILVSYHTSELKGWFIQSRMSKTHQTHSCIKEHRSDYIQTIQQWTRHLYHTVKIEIAFYDEWMN